MQKGLIQVYTGEGKGKTTAAFGLALRAAGRGLHVSIVQFFKTHPSGEVLAIRQHFPEITIHQVNSQRKFSWDMNEEERTLLSVEIRAGFMQVKEFCAQRVCDLLILDEIMYMLKYAIIPLEELIDLLTNKPDSMEIVLTGRDAPPELIAIADLVTEMKNIKHPYAQDIPMRTGIEF